MMDPGYYVGTLVEWGCNKSDTGTGYVFLIFAIDGQGYERTLRMFTSKGAWPYTKEKLERLGFDGEDFPASMYRGPETRLVCHHEEYEGKMREKWDLAAPAVRPDDNTDMTQSFKKHWQAEHGPPKRSAPPEAPARPDPADRQPHPMDPSNQPPHDDEIPF